MLHEVWFLNPAATYSPLLGSTMAAWWMAPMGNDLLAKFVQAPALVLVFFALLRLGRILGARAGVAALLALTAVLSKPFIRQVLVVKDDLYLTGLFLMALIALSDSLLRSKLGPWRLGIAMGLFLATKVTALMALPMLLLAVNAPLRGMEMEAVVCGHRHSGRAGGAMVRA